MTFVPTRHRALFLSDFHLGSWNCKAARLAAFLRRHDAERIYLVGDILDRERFEDWPPYHDDVIQLLVQKCLDGAVLYYVPGNHDHLFRWHLGAYGRFHIARQTEHTTLGGARLLVAVTWIERKTGWHLWEAVRRTLASWVQHHTRSYVRKMMKLSEEYAGVVCGHIHQPAIIRGRRVYLNPGDWTHHCTAIVERLDGHFEMLHG